MAAENPKIPKPSDKQEFDPQRAFKDETNLIAFVNVAMVLALGLFSSIIWVSNTIN